MFVEVVVPLLIIGVCLVACAVMFTIWRRRRPTHDPKLSPEPDTSVPIG